MTRGVLLVAGGLLIGTAGVAWGLDAWGMTKRFYNYTIRSWSRIPGVGESWIRMTPFRAFRLQALLAWTLFGLLLIGIGVHLMIAAG
jgi:hypothetical protein